MTKDVRHADRFRVLKGALGPVPECELEIKPLTVFIGPQGTGKSLVAQILYFFEELPYLVSYVEATEDSKRWSEANIVRHLLDRLRSSDRAFGTFANPKFTAAWTRSFPFPRPKMDGSVELSVNVQAQNRRVYPSRSLREFVSSARQTKRPARRYAMFAPTERMVISQLRSAMAERVLSLPLTYLLFSDWVEQAAAVTSDWPGGKPPTKESRWVLERGEKALRGRAVRYRDEWKWRFASKGQFDIDLASSGQRANWSLVYLAHTLFSMRESGRISKKLTLFVEEPEIHLHPDAQSTLVEVLAYLVRAGFRVLLTTHSLTVLYAINNLVQAAGLPRDAGDGFPEERIRLPKRDVAVYAFHEGKPPRSLVDPTGGFIDERELGSVADSLSAMLNRIVLRKRTNG